LGLCVVSHPLRTVAEELIPEFASDFLATAIGRLQIDQLSRQIIGMTNINSEEIRDLRIPVPRPEKQAELVAAMNAARAARHKRLAELNGLFDGLDAFTLNAIGLKALPRPRSTFAILRSEVNGVLNPDRYRAMQLEKHLPFTERLEAVGTLLDSRCSPEKEAPAEDWDWIRIDDLPNNPWQVESVRTHLGQDIKGSFFEVRENDILIARLGPTILNAKFVICPKTPRRTVASSEFLVVRCNKAVDPVAVLWILRSALYREIMYLRSRGGTPSRFRLDGLDLLTIPFPTLNDHQQSAIATEARRRHKEAKRLRMDADADWQAAKRWFEEQLLGGLTS
jgi:type I restriction enzyme S subunit